MEKNLLYKKFAEHYDDIYFWKDTRNEVEFIDKLVDKHKLGRIVLDIACGTGRHAALMEEKGYDVVGIDINESMLKIARKKVKGVEFLEGDMKDLKVKDKSFDVVMCMFTAITYNKTLDELKQTLSNFYDVLNSPGMVVFDLGVSKNTYKRGKINMNIIDREYPVVRFGQVERIDDQAFFNFVFLTKEDGKVDFSIDRHEMGFFSIEEVIDVMKAVGFKVNVFEGFSTKKFKRENPVFIGIKK
jgi:ubiquinone/menaquinone biosynthesis C-methylase UbiE